MEKAFLFDVVSKLYISTDSGPVDMQSVELCSDMIDVVLDVSGIYGLGPSHAALQAASSAAKESLVGEDERPENDSDGAALTTPEEAATASMVGTLISQAPAVSLEEEIIDPDSAYDSESASVIRLSNGMVRNDAPHFKMTVSAVAIPKLMEQNRVTHLLLSCGF